jgi:pimeloyl-ACP methyl ester carboxylesterase
LRIGLSEKTQQNVKSAFSIQVGENTELDMIWLHGWGQSHKSLLGLAGLFKKSAKNTLFDLPGFGKTPQLKDGASTKDYADWLHSIIGPKSGPRILIGHSYGGRVAVQMAAHYQDDVDAIILISGAGLKRKRGIMWKLRAAILKIIGLETKILDAVFKTKFKDAYSNRFGSRDYKNSGPLKGTFISAVTENLNAEAQAVSCPTLLIYGEEDSETPPEIGQEYQRLIQNSDLKILKGFDHFNILSHGANQCQSLISLFLEHLK